MPEFDDRLDVTDTADRTTFALRNECLNYSFSDPLKAAIKDLTAERTARGIRNFVLDLSAVSFMDSCGLSVLIAMRKAVEQAHARMVVVAPSPIVMRLLTITRLDHVFEVCTTVEAADAALAHPPTNALDAASA